MCASLLWSFCKEIYIKTSFVFISFLSLLELLVIQTVQTKWWVSSNIMKILDCKNINEKNSTPGSLAVIMSMRKKQSICDKHTCMFLDKGDVSFLSCEMPEVKNLCPESHLRSQGACYSTSLHIHITLNILSETESSKRYSFVHIEQM